MQKIKNMWKIFSRRIVEMQDIVRLYQKLKKGGATV